MQQPCGRQAVGETLSVERIVGRQGPSRLVSIATRVISLNWSPFVEFLTSEAGFQEGSRYDPLRRFGATECIAELVRFLILKADAERPSTLSPTGLVDDIWHRLLLFPRLYYQVCHAISGKIMDHNPNEATGPPAKRSARIHNTIDAYAQTFPGWPSALWASGLPSKNAIVVFQRDRLELATLSLPRAMSETDILAVLSSQTGIRASAMELIWQQRAVQSAEFPLKSFIFDGGGNPGGVQRPLETFPRIIADVQCPSSLAAVGSSNLHNPRSAFHVHVKNLTGETITIYAASGDCIGDLKPRIQETEGTPADQQRLIFSGKQLEDEQTVGHYKLQQGCMIHLVFRLKGC
eukprot:jgi/Mesvir1/13112/Mv26295-RA.1